ncbi:MAG: hypothetical protein HY352_00175 [Candidatus Omnitrophica bacterium]|nr:hypothetical protein [Candidatus Omnitrophota bacterium]
MRRSKVLSSVLVVGIVLVGIIGARSLVAAKHAPAYMLHVSGKVLAIDAKAEILRLEAEKPLDALSGGRLVDFAINGKTVIAKEDRRVQPTELQFGEQVQIEYVVERGKNVARSITVDESTQIHTPKDVDTPQESEPLAPTPASPYGAPR